MADLPISFSPPMVRALLAGSKTQTRRILRMPGIAFDAIFNDEGVWYIGDALTGKYEAKLPVRYKRGDRLYVREAWRSTKAYDDLSPSEMGGDEPLKYEADGVDQMWGWPGAFPPGRFRQGMHMPKWASRMTLIVTDVRVQRLQEISEADAIAEGIERNEFGGFLCYASEPKGQTHWADPRESYRTLWDSINGPGAWAANPWIVAYSFRLIMGNIDQIEGGDG